MATFIKFQEVSILDREEFVYINPDQVTSVSQGQLLEGLSLIHMYDGQSYLVDDTPDRVLFRLGHSIG